MPAFIRKHYAVTQTDNSYLATLLTQIQAGDQTSLGRLYDETVGRVYGLALRVTGNPADAEEVTCDVYQQLWRTAKRFDPVRGNPSQWIMVIARSRAVDRYRQRRDHSDAPHMAACDQHNLSDGNPTAEEVLHQFEVGTAIHAALSNLSAIQARLIGLAFFEGLSHREIACRTQLPLGTVKSNIWRALNVLRKMLSATDAVDELRL